MLGPRIRPLERRAVVVRKHRDEGLGLVEVLVAMIIVAILFLAIGSLLIKALTVTAANSTKATADQLASAVIEKARVAAITGDCANVKAAVEVTTTSVDGRGIPLTVTGDVDNRCTQTAGNEHAEPKLTTITVTVTTTAPGFKNPVATNKSDVFVKFP